MRLLLLRDQAGLLARLCHYPGGWGAPGFGRLPLSRRFRANMQNRSTDYEGHYVRWARFTRPRFSPAVTRSDRSPCPATRLRPGYTIPIKLDVDSSTALPETAANQAAVICPLAWYDHTIAEAGSPSHKATMAGKLRSQARHPLVGLPIECRPESGSEAARNP